MQYLSLRMSSLCSSHFCHMTTQKTAMEETREGWKLTEKFKNWKKISVSHWCQVMRKSYFAHAGAPLTSSSHTWNWASIMKSNPNSWKLEYPSPSVVNSYIKLETTKIKYPQQQSVVISLTLLGFYIANGCTSQTIYSRVYEDNFT